MGNSYWAGLRCLLLTPLVAMCLAPAAHAASSANYEISISVLDGGGQVSSSGVYSVLTATAQAGEIGAAASTNYTFQYGHISQQYEALPPTTPEVTITPAVPTTTDVLLCTVTTETIVAPGLTAKYEYVWSNGVDEVRHGPVVSLTDTLSSAFTLKNQTWTCSVRGFDGTSYSPVAGVDSVTTVNTPPGAPALSFPARQSSGLNLVCEVVGFSYDPDLDPITYTFDWSVKRAGESTFSPFGGAIPSPTLSLVQDQDTANGDEWLCVVTPADDEGPGDAAVTPDPCIIQIGIVESHVSLATEPTSIILGQSLTATGDIFPAPDAEETTVFFESTSPSGTVDPLFPESVTISGASFTRSFVPTEASEGRSPWQLKASITGDAILTPGESDQVPFTVLKAQPSLALSLDHSSVPNPPTALEATATLSASLHPSLSGLLADREIKIFLREPDANSAGPVVGTTDADGVATFSLADFSAAGITFTEPGTWQFIAEFDGDENFRSSTSPGFERPDSARLTVKDGAGYAILVVGKLDEIGEGQPEHTKTMDYVYRSLVDRGFAPEDIYYMAEGAADPYPDIHVDDVTPTKTEVRNAIEVWARDRMNATPAPLYIVWLDHGRRNEFYVHSSSDADTISAIELSNWLYNLEGSLSDLALSRERVFVYGACHSGSFINAVSAPGRILVTSSSEDEVSHRGVKNPADGTDVRDGEPLVTEFFRNARTGMTLKASFEDAAQRIEEYTAEKSNGVATGLVPQHPLLDDDGDGAGTWWQGLLVVPGHDGAAAHEAVLGFGVNAAGDSVGWVEATRPVALDFGDTLELEARATPIGGNHTAWCEVKTPDYTGGDDADPSLPDFQKIVPLLTFLYEPAISDVAGTGTYRWRDGVDFQDTFADPGTYNVYYYIQDEASLETSAHLMTTVYRLSGTNTPPGPVTLLYPADGAAVFTTSFFNWTRGTDPDGDDVTYRIELATDMAFTQDVLRRANLSMPCTQVPGVEDDTTYYWRVFVVDEYGAESSGNTVWQVTFDNTNTEEYGAINGWVRDTSNTPIANATVTVRRFDMSPATVQTDFLGFYFRGNLEPAASYEVKASKDGYEEASQSVAVARRNASLASFELAPEGAYQYGELSCDGQVGVVDASLILQWLTLLIDHFCTDPGVVWPNFPVAADVNCDGNLGTLDARDILQWKVGLIDCFTCDTNCDGWGPEDTGKAAVHRARTAKQGPVRLLALPNDLMADPGDIVEVPVTLDDGSGVLGYFVSLSYADHWLTFLEASSGDLTVSWDAPVTNAQTGQLRFANAGSAPLEGSGAICVLRFRVEEAASGQDVAITVDEVQLNDGAVNVTAQAGMIYVSGEPCELPGVPTDVTASDGVSGDDVAIAWSAVPGATAYRVYRANSDTVAAAELLATTTETFYQDTDTVPLPTADGGCNGGVVPVVYFYWVEAVNACGPSGLSASDSGYRGPANDIRAGSIAATPELVFFLAIAVVLLGVRIGSRRVRQRT